MTTIDRTVEFGVRTLARARAGRPIPWRAVLRVVCVLAALACLDVAAFVAGLALGWTVAPGLTATGLSLFVAEWALGDPGR